MSNYLVDFHVHTSLCNHANGTMKQYVKSAIENGLQGIGFADHNPMPCNYGERFRMRYHDMEIYINTINELRNHFSKIDIKLGIELDFVENEEKYLRDFVSEFEFDYVIGSVHYMRNNNSNDFIYLGDLNQESKTEKFKKYFKLIEKAAIRGIYDVISHFDLPKRFWGRMSPEEIQFARNALDTIKKADVCLEINTSGFRTRDVNEPFPGSELLDYASRLEIPITLGSDAHNPDKVGSYFIETINLLKKFGFKKIANFKKREREIISIV